MDSLVKTKELNRLLSYMSEILINEFPTNEFTPEYLILSMLDCSNTHAYMILDNCLMTQHISQLKDIYVNFLRNKEVQLINKENKPKYSKELEIILTNAKNESNKCNTQIVGSEHVLLSMLSTETNNSKIQEVFKNVGVDYNFLKNKSTERVSSTKNQIANKRNMKPNFIMPLKSDINQKALTNKSSHITPYTINITQQAKEGKIDELIGRSDEMQQVIRTMARRKKNNVILVGDGGVGKTSIVYGLAKMIAENNVPEFLMNKEIVKLNIMSLVSGTHFRGMLEERINGLFNELKECKNYILFIDDIHVVLKSGNKDKDTDLSPMLGTILNENNVQVIGTTNFKEYRNSIENNPSLSRQFQKIIIEPTTVEKTIDILKCSRKYYEEYHHVLYSDDVINSCVKLAQRYITDRSLPDSAFDIIDLCGANACFNIVEPSNIIFAKKRLLEINKERENSLNEGDFEYADKLTQEENSFKLLIADYNRNHEQQKTIITENDVASVISNITKIPINKLDSNEKTKIANIDKILKESIIGQDEAVETVSRVIKRNRVGLNNKTKSTGNILLVGPSGSGKTLLAKKLAEQIYGDENALIRIDMSEYSEKSSISKLLGSAPGYVGYESGGKLTESVKNKQYCVLLLDEIEKANQEVYNVFLQLFDEGRLTDSSGQLINFKNVLVLMTSNIGAKKAADFGGGIGFNNDENENKKSIIEKEIKNKFTPEFINRIDAIVHFNSLTEDNLHSIVNLELKKLNNRLNEIQYSIQWDDNVIEYLTKQATKEKEYGARPIIRIIQNELENKITDLILENDFEPNYTFKIENNNEKLNIY